MTREEQPMGERERERGRLGQGKVKGSEYESEVGTVDWRESEKENC